MKSYHIHIEGIVQGVGFRPFVYKYAKKENLTGWVNNTNDGVHIHLNCEKQKAGLFLQTLLSNLPPLAVVTRSEIKETTYQTYSDFEIIHSVTNTKPNLLLTPDATMCLDCKEELHNSKDRRFHYPFITCTNCGPRFSIISSLPYDRPNTTMDSFKMCAVCQKEYDNHLERRHYSQTNSCPDCRIEMQLFEKGVLKERFTDLDYIVQNWNKGKIIAIKGIGGYLLTCDATDEKAIKTLRQRKQRPTKPFALMYPSIEAVKKDVLLSEKESKELQSIHAPIVLLETKDSIKSKVVIDAVSHGLSRLGIMLPYTPLYELLLHSFHKPIIATSANITNSTIIYTDDKAIQELIKIADIILLNNREILIPQDDGVVQFTRKYQQKITLRRSRGKAPNYINPNLKAPKEAVLATGAMLKSVFGLFNRQNTYISQYMGNTSSYDAQLNYENTFSHFKDIFDTKIHAVVVDKHPDYFSTRFGNETAQNNKSQVFEIQHHKAHFYSVLGEHNLLDSKERILGVIWDGTGLGDDKNIWGGEFFTYEKGVMERVFHIDEFDFILADKMPKEPRISALAIAHNIAGATKYLKHKFTSTEWQVYKKLLAKESTLKGTSMGRLFDAVASILLDFDVHSYEAEASMLLEKTAADYAYNNSLSLAESYMETDKLPDNFVEFIIACIFNDIEQNIDKQFIAAAFHVTLVDYIIRIAEKFQISKIAFSGGVFQNALLVDMVLAFMNSDYELYFQNEFSPNDEGIPFGQLMYFASKKK